MKKRLLVMNGSCIVENEQENGSWRTEKVEKSNGIKPGIYNIYLAVQADKTKEYTGIILHADKTSVYQKTGKSSYVLHHRDDFPRPPEIGAIKHIRYDDGKAVITDATTVNLKLSR